MLLLLLSLLNIANAHILLPFLLLLYKGFDIDKALNLGLFGGSMSINSIDHEEMNNITNKWEIPEGNTSKSVKSAQARRRIETLREIRDSGLSIEEAREMGLIH